MDSDQLVRTDSSTVARLWDCGYDASTDTEYECLDCGVIIVADAHPGDCPTCAAALRNRSMPME